MAIHHYTSRRFLSVAMPADMTVVENDQEELEQASDEPKCPFCGAEQVRSGRLVFCTNCDDDLIEARDRKRR